MKTAIIIPARYGSTRLPGKPLAKIAGQTLLQRVVRLAQTAARNDPSIAVVVATDDDRIAAHAVEIGAHCVMTPEACPTGTDRVAAAVRQLDTSPDFVLNMQGDAPLTPPAYLTAMIDSFRADPCDVVTPVTALSWPMLDTLRKDKQTTPFSGTTVVFDERTGRALWFSKNIIPAIRKEQTLRTTTALSPIWKHIGLYGYSHTMLETFVTLPEGRYEALEGLEQLRILESGYTVRCVPVEAMAYAGLGIDSPEDIERAEALIAQYGELTL